MEKKFSEKTLDFWEKMLSEPNVCVDFGPGGADGFGALCKAVEARKKEREKNAAKKQSGGESSDR